MSKLGSAPDYPLHGGQLRQITKRFGIPESELLDFSANINPLGPPPSVLPTLHACLDEPSTLTAYPDLQQIDLKRAVACYAGTKSENVIVANGFVPLLEATLRTLGITTCSVPVPAFVEYRKTLERMNVQVVPRPLDSAFSFAYKPAALIKGQQQAVLLANPQNPSGVCHNVTTMCELVGRALDQKTYVLLDEAFIDYVPEHSLSAMSDQFPNLIVFRSVTKFFGFPGLRIAYATANATLTEQVSESLPPWPITTLASHAVIAALSDEAYAIRSRSENNGRRIALQSEFALCGLDTYPASANFILFRLPSFIDPNLFWQKMIVEHRIVLRSCANYEALGSGHFRAAVQTEAENCRLIDAIAKQVSQCSTV